MRHGKRSRRLSLATGHRNSLLRNMTASLVEHGRIKTTLGRARVLRPYVEKLVTKLKEPTPQNMRYVYSKMPHKRTVQDIAKKVSPVFKDRKGGYIRILKLAKRRVGDCAEQALVEWVDESLVNYYINEKEKQEVKAKAQKSANAPKKKTTKKTAKTAKTSKTTKKNTTKKKVTKKKD